MRAAEAQVKAVVDEAVASYDPLEKATLDELDELEDDEDEDVLAAYRKKRMAEMRPRLPRHFGKVVHIREDEYRVEVSDEAAADRETWVVVHLFRETMTACVIINRALDDLARRFPGHEIRQDLRDGCEQVPGRSAADAAGVPEGDRDADGRAARVRRAQGPTPHVEFPLRRMRRHHSSEIENPFAQ